MIFQLHVVVLSANSGRVRPTSGRVCPMLSCAGPTSYSLRPTYVVIGRRSVVASRSRVAFRPISGCPRQFPGWFRLVIGRFRPRLCWFRDLVRPNLGWSRPSLSCAAVLDRLWATISQILVALDHIGACFGQFRAGFGQFELVSTTSRLAAPLFHRCWSDDVRLHATDFRLRWHIFGLGHLAWPKFGRNWSNLVRFVRH